jgi:hypothetical protein
MRVPEFANSSEARSEQGRPRVPAPADGTGAPDAADAAAVALLKQTGYAFLSSAAGCRILGCDVAQLRELAEAWERLPPDRYLRDAGRYRFRRHSCFVQDRSTGLLATVAHRPHWQSTQYNALHGGIERLFDPIEAPIVASAAWTRMLTALGELFAQLRAVERWFIEAHQFRIDTATGIGRPTPEGAHRDGVDFVAVLLMGRRGVRGGETRVHGADGRFLGRRTLRAPGSMLLMDDARVVHETTPIRPTSPPGVRDTLVLTYRSGGFQSSAVSGQDRP